MAHETGSGGDIRHAFMDFEASALGPGSYPIEVAWGWVDTFEIESYLIRPTDEWLESGHWDEVAEDEIHKLSQAQLLKDGVPVETVAERMIAVLAGNAAYSDGPRFDGEWLDKLFQAAGRRRPVEIESIDVLLRARFDIEVAWAAEEEAKKTCPPTHRAADDVRHLLEIYRIAADRTQRDLV
jgi:hypothetical protein